MLHIISTIITLYFTAVKILLLKNVFPGHMFNLLDMTSKIHIITMFINGNIQTIFHKQCVGTFITDLHQILHKKLCCFII